MLIVVRSSSLRTLVTVGLLAGCAGPYEERRDEPVVRKFGERLVEGAYVSPSAYEHYILARLKEAAGRPEEAVDELRRALGSDGTSAYLRVRLADALLATGRVDEARDELDAVMRLEPDNAEAYLVRARLFARLGQRQQVDVALERAIALDDTYEEAYLALATSQREAGHDGMALATLQKLVAHAPSAAAEEILGRAAIVARDRKAARDHLRRAVELDGSRNDARVELARIAFADGDAELALGWLSNAAERTREPALVLELARLEDRAGHHGDAREILDRQEEEARTGPMKLDVAQAFLEVGVPKRAVAIAQGVAKDDRRPEVRSAARALSARAFERDGSNGDALEAWQGIGPGDAEYPRAVEAIAHLRRARGRDREAQATLEAAITDRTQRNRLDERDQLIIALCRLRAELGDRPAAIGKLEELAATRRVRTSSRRGSRSRTSSAQADDGRRPWRSSSPPRVSVSRARCTSSPTFGWAWARSSMRRSTSSSAASRWPHSAEIADSLGVAYLAAGRLDDAERLLTRADRLGSPDPEVLMHVAELWQRRDQRDRAIAALRRAAAARPSEPCANRDRVAPPHARARASGRAVKLALFAGALLLAGCPQALPPVERPYAPPSADELYASLRSRADKIHAIDASAKADEHAPHTPSAKLKVQLYAQRPDKLRLSSSKPRSAAARRRS